MQCQYVNLNSTMLKTSVQSMDLMIIRRLILSPLRVRHNRLTPRKSHDEHPPDKRVSARYQPHATPNPDGIIFPVGRPTGPVQRSCSENLRAQSSRGVYLVLPLGQ